MTLDEYRVWLIERLKTSQDAAAARSLLAEAELMLTNAHLTQLTHDRFWETVDDDLNALGEDAKFLSDPKAASVLGAVVAAARTRIARYRQRTVDDSNATDNEA